nr:MAG TPA: hypothetical protein [Caudoviricetes sp.]
MGYRLRRASLIKGLISTPTRRGPTFVRTKVGKIRLGRRPKTPTHRNARPERLRRPGS